MVDDGVETVTRWNINEGQEKTYFLQFTKLIKK